MKMRKFKNAALLLLLFTAGAQAADTRTYTKISSKEARIKIDTVQKDSIQAAVYLDGQENKKFIQDLMEDKNSPLYKIKLSLEKENCGTISTKKWIAGCGQVTITDEVRTSFGRAGWESGGAGYTFFMGFTNEGSGHFFDVSYMITISERSEAKANKQGEYLGVVMKTLDLARIKKLDEQTP